MSSAAGIRLRSGNMEISSFKSKLGRRIIILFLCCALVPIVALAAISFRTVIKQLNEQSRRQLHQDTKAIGMSIIERLSFIETELRLAASTIKSDPEASISRLSEEYRARLRDRFDSVVYMSGPLEIPILTDKRSWRPTLTEEQQAHLESGRSVIFSAEPEDNHRSLNMVVALDPLDLSRGFLLAEIKKEPLFSAAGFSLPELIQLCLLDDAGEPLYSSSADFSIPCLNLSAKAGRSHSGSIQWNDGGQDYLVSFRSVFMKYRFFVPDWKLILSIRKDDLLAPTSDFRLIFSSIVILSFALVLLFSLVQIRRSLVPLQKLQEGTRRISRKEFESEVKVKSGDEFEELADSFNEMASTLGKQFNALSTLADVDRGILSSLETGSIVHTALAGIKKVAGFDFVIAFIMIPGEEGRVRALLHSDTASEEGISREVPIPSEERKKLLDNPDGFMCDTGAHLPEYLSSFMKKSLISCWVVPFFIKESLAGMLALFSNDPSSFKEDNLDFVRQIANQIGVALSNAQLIEELDEMNWGTILALARTVDAKSPWTAGHSERVTDLALRIASGFQLPEKEMENLRRAGLLHDIGKIATPAQVLDKAGSLDDSERKLIEQHPGMGVKIIEPIKPYADIHEIILQHHEWYDGSGYPNGDSREEICLQARILTLADCYDALLSDRPYRDGMDKDLVRKIIEEENGTHFDPQVVKVFFEMVYESGDIRNYEENG
jgi:putative nucleotidyltransferase with HDIG domain